MATKESTLLDTIRRWALWAFIGSAVVLLLFSIQQTWGDDPQASYGRWDDGPNAWDKIESTAGILMAMSLLVLLGILISSRVRRADECCSECSDECCDECCKDDATRPTPPAAAKAATAKKAAPKTK